MSKDVIQVDGKDVVVREDTAKAYRGANWAWISIAAFILITAAIFAVFLLSSARDGSVVSPSANSISNSRDAR